MKFLTSRKPIIVAVFLCVPAFLFLRTKADQPRTYLPEELPIAFWAWRNQAPTSDEVAKAFESTGANVLFLRAGQLTIENSLVTRRSGFTGRLPEAPEIHLVYNADRELLSALETVSAEQIAQAAADAFRADAERSDGLAVSIKGIQLDIDFPTRLLPKYSEVLVSLKTLVPEGTVISITGLPTWMSSRELPVLLENVEFWIPQFYGNELPMNDSDSVPISSKAELIAGLNRARGLGKPFYAGLSAYGYSIMYGKDGNLVELRGDLDPSLVLKHPGLRQTGARKLAAGDTASEVRYTYEATTDLSLAGTIMKQGETLAIDHPSTDSLRQAARAVRENGGEHLRGICIFRLPTADDKTTLTIEEISAALNDKESVIGVDISARRSGDGRLDLNISNNGNASAGLGYGAVSVDLHFPAETRFRLADSNGFDSVEPLCALRKDLEPRPCRASRSNVIRVTRALWRPGDRATLVLSTAKEPPEILEYSTYVRSTDGTLLRSSSRTSIKYRGQDVQ